MSTVNPVQSTTYDLSTSNNPITFGSGTYISAGGGDGVYGGPGLSWNVTNAGTIIGGLSIGGGSVVLDGSGSTLTNEAGGIIGLILNGAANYFGVSLRGDTSTVTNAGTIIGYKSAVYLGGVGNSLINESGGIIECFNRRSGPDALGVDAKVSGTVTNYGTIRTYDKFLGQFAYDGTGVYLYAESGDTSTVTNAGTISGQDSVQFGGPGAHALILETGSSLIGAAVGSTASGATNALVLEGTGTANNAFENFDTLTVQNNASWALGGSSTLGGASSEFGEATIDSGAVLDFEGETTIAGTVSGAGTLEFGGGSTTLDSGAKLSVANWTLGGSGTTVTLDENLAYGGAFTANAGATLDLSGGNLTLTGTDVFSGAATSGSQVLYAEGTTIVLGLTVGGTTTFDDTSEVIESGGSTTVGDAAGDIATLTIAAGATWDILDNSGIKHGSSTASSIGNSGLIEKTGGKGTSTIAPKVANNGTILVSSGTLDLKGAVSGGTAATPGTDTISGASTLEFGSTVGSRTTVGSQDIGFTGGGTLDLRDPKAFWGEISGFAPTDAVDLLGSWAFSRFSEVSGVGKLTLTSGTAKHTFDFVGELTQSSFNIVSGTTTTTITHT